MARNQAAPTHSLDAEMAVLGAALVDAASAATIVAALTPQSFYHQAHVLVMTVIQTLVAAGDPVDLVTVSGKLRSTPQPGTDGSQLDAIGGAAYLAELANAVHTTANVEYHCDIITEAARIRHIANEARILLKGLAEGTPADQAIARLTHVVTSDGTTNTKIKTITMAEARRNVEIPWLIPDYLVEGEFSVLYGQPSAGKTFLALRMALAVAYGHEFLGRRVKKGAVRWIAAEGAPAIGARLDAWAHYEKEDDSDNFEIIDQVVNLMDPQSVSQYIAYAKTVPDLALTVFDTLSLSIPGGDENDAGDLGIAIASIKRIQAETGSHVTAIHHSTKASPRSERGSGALRGAADTMLFLSHDESNGERKLLCEKQRRYDPFKPTTWTLERIGSSAVLVQLGDEASTQAMDAATVDRKRQPQLNEAQIELLEVLATRAEGYTKKELVDLVGDSTTTIQSRLTRLKELRRITFDAKSGRYSVRLAKLTKSTFVATSSDFVSTDPNTAQQQAHSLTNHNFVGSSTKSDEVHPQITSSDFVSTDLKGSLCDVSSLTKLTDEPTSSTSSAAEAGGGNFFFPPPPKGGGREEVPTDGPATGTSSGDEKPLMTNGNGPATGSEKFTSELTHQEDL